MLSPGFFFWNGEQSFKVCYHFFEFRNQEFKPLNQLHLCHFKSAQGFFDFLTCRDQLDRQNVFVKAFISFGEVEHFLYTNAKTMRSTLTIGTLFAYPNFHTCFMLARLGSSKRENGQGRVEES